VLAATAAQAPLRIKAPGEIPPPEAADSASPTQTRLSFLPHVVPCLREDSEPSSSVIRAWALTLVDQEGTVIVVTPCLVSR
jgi:hypothetical protein